jgi:hypothetical protein
MRTGGSVERDAFSAGSLRTETNHSPDFGGGRQALLRCPYFMRPHRSDKRPYQRKIRRNQINVYTILFD